MNRPEKNVKKCAKNENDQSLHFGTKTEKAFLLQPE